MDYGLLRSRGSRVFAGSLLSVALAVTVVSAETPAQAATAAPASVSRTAVSTAAVPSFPSSMVLKVGSTGPQVKAVQQALTKRGYKIGSHTAGVYNQRTANAVSRFKAARSNVYPAGPNRYKVGPATYRDITAVLRPAQPKSSWSAWRAGSSYRYTTAAYARWYAAKRLAAYGWSSSQMTCLRPMWIGESHWSYTEVTGSYVGIPQTTSGVVNQYGFSMASYRANPEVQVEVGLRYIRDRYGSPCAAWTFWKAQGARQDANDPAQWWGGWY